ncbi:hypothetical protein K504DRAFT_394301, partial [Pleomassaria siparia CBS 279.74]
RPVFVANSLLSAVWLLRASVAKETLSHKKRHNKRKRTEDNKDEEGGEQGEQEQGQEEGGNKVEEEGEGGEDKEGQEPTHINTVTSNNRRAARQREARLHAQLKRRRVSLGLVEPGKEAPGIERAAYTLIEPKDEGTVSWILQQRTTEDRCFLSTARQPYATVRTMLEKAKAMGNTTAAAHARLFLQAWQARGSPVVRAISGPPVPSPSEAAGTSTAVKPYSFSAL